MKYVIAIIVFVFSFFFCWAANAESAQGKLICKTEGAIHDLAKAVEESLEAAKIALHIQSDLGLCRYFGDRPPIVELTRYIRLVVAQDGTTLEMWEGVINGHAIYTFVTPEGA